MASTDHKSFLNLFKDMEPLLRDSVLNELDTGLPELHVNHKTTFATPLAINVNISELELHSSADRGIRHLTQARDKLMRTLANETKCASCPNVDVQVDENRNLTTGDVMYRLSTKCKLGKSGMSSVICPDGTISARNGQFSQARMEPPLVYEPSEMALRESSRPRDEPSTNLGDTAW